MFENQTLNKNRVLPSAMILDRLSIECIAKAATKEKIIEKAGLLPCFFILRFFKKILDNRTKGGYNIDKR